MEVDLGKGLLKAVKLKVDNWTHIQQLDYEKMPFKCKVCHGYGHFTNRCSKNETQENNIDENQEQKWEQVKKKKTKNKTPHSTNTIP